MPETRRVGWLLARSRCEMFGFAVRRSRWTSPKASFITFELYYCMSTHILASVQLCFM